MALLRQGARAVLCAVERVEEGSLEQPPLPRRATNRARILARCDSEAHDAWDSVAAVELGEATYEIDEGNFDSLEEASTEDLLLLAEILRAGYVPHPEIEQENFSLLRLCAWQLAASSTACRRASSAPCTPGRAASCTPAARARSTCPSAPATARPTPTSTLRRGSGGPFWVHSVELVDLNPEREMPKDADPRAWASFQQDMECLCPRGMCVPAIVYEEEGNRQLDFFDAAHLDAVPGTPGPRRRDERRGPALPGGGGPPRPCRCATRSCKRPCRRMRTASAPRPCAALCPCPRSASRSQRRNLDTFGKLSCFFGQKRELCKNCTVPRFCLWMFYRGSTILFHRNQR